MCKPLYQRQDNRRPELVDPSILTLSTFQIVWGSRSFTHVYRVCIYWFLRHFHSYHECRFDGWRIISRIPGFILDEKVLKVIFCALGTIENPESFVLTLPPLYWRRKHSKVFNSIFLLLFSLSSYFHTSTR